MSLIGKQFFQLGLISLASYPLGFLIQLLMSYYFGTSAQVDAYWVVLTLINFFGFFVHPVREAIVSGYHLRRAEGKELADRYLSSAVNLLVLMLLASSALLYGSPGFFAAWLIGEGKNVLLEEVIRLLYYAAPLVTLLFVSEIFSGFLVSTGRIFFQDIGRIVGSALAVVCLWTLAGRIGVVSMIAAALASNLILVAVQILALRNSVFSYRFFSMPRIDPASLRMSGALTISYFISQLYILYERTVFAGLGDGTLAAFQYAISLNNVFYAICIGNLCNVVWPRIVGLVVACDEDGVRRLLVASIRNILILIVFLCLFFWCYADAATYLIFFRGEFDVWSLNRTAGFFRAVLISLPFLAISGILGRLLASRQFTAYLFGVGVCSASGGAATLAFAQLTGSLVAAGYHTAVSAACGAAVSVYAAYRLYLQHLAPGGRQAGFLWLCKGLLLVIIALAVFLSAPLDTAGGKLSMVSHLMLRFIAGGLFFSGMAYRFGLLHLADGFKLFTARKFGRSG